MSEDKNEFVYELPRSTFSSRSQEYIDPIRKPTEITNSWWEFAIPQHRDLLAQCYLKITVTMSSLINDVSLSNFAANVFDRIQFSTTHSNVLQTITPDYTLKRIVEMDSSLQANLLDLIATTNASGTKVVYLPLFLFISESPGHFINTNFVEQLYIRAHTASTTTEFGGGLEGFPTYEDFNVQLVCDFVTGESVPSPRPYSMLVYDIVEHATVDVPIGTTETSVHIPPMYRNLFSTTATIRDSEGRRFTMTNIRVKVDNITTYVADRLLNTMQNGWWQPKSEWSIQSSSRDSEDTFISRSYALYNDRITHCGSIFCGDIPLYVTVGHDDPTTSANAKMYTFSEYWKIMMVNERGEITVKF